MRLRGSPNVYFAFVEFHMPIGMSVPSCLTYGLECSNYNLAAGAFMERYIKTRGPRIQFNSLETSI